MGFHGGSNDPTDQISALASPTSGSGASIRPSGGASLKHSRSTACCVCQPILEEHPTEESCKSEIDSVAAHGQLAPALGPLRGEADHDVAIVCTAECQNPGGSLVSFAIGDTIRLPDKASGSMLNLHIAACRDHYFHLSTLTESAELLEQKLPCHPDSCRTRAISFHFLRTAVYTLWG